MYCDYHEYRNSVQFMVYYYFSVEVLHVVRGSHDEMQGVLYFVLKTTRAFVLTSAEDVSLCLSVESSYMCISILLELHVAENWSLL